MQLERSIQVTRTLDYLLYLPEGYAEDGPERWPLILFLHGAGERGSDLNSVKKNGLPKIIDQGQALPFVVVSPQCPENAWWPQEIGFLGSLIDKTIETCRIDPARVYLTGLSMGGYGTWHMATTMPGRFAAIAPVCGGFYGPPRMLSQSLKEMPIWAFHGAKDPVVPLEQSARLVEALRAEGAGEEQVRFTIYPEAQHDSWTETYENPELYTWFLSHSR